jgi:hypothetical protein
MFMSRIIGKVYHARNYDNIEHEIERKKKLGQRDEEESEEESGA